MVRFSSPEKQGMKQAAAVMKQLQGKVIKSVGTVRNYEQALRNVARELARHGESLKDITPERMQSYLEARSCDVGQSALDMERQAVQVMMQHITHQLDQGERLPVVKTQLDEQLESRAYTREQVALIVECQSERNALATEIAYSTGLRAHELYTLRLAEDRPADDRPALESKFEGRDNTETYTVIGKGGLIREVEIPRELAERLEERRLDAPERVTNRGVHYEQHYELGAGQAWSQSFSTASKETLDWSKGGHGLRHSYAQERMHELQARGYTRETALETTSQEMGHFRSEIAETYLR